MDRPGRSRSRRRTDPPPADQIFHLHAEFCRILASEKRLRILWALGEEELSVGELAERLGLPMQNVSQHLRIMKDRGAVEARRAGRTIYYRLRSRKFIEGCRLIRKGLEEIYKEDARVFGPRGGSGGRRA